MESIVNKKFDNYYNRTYCDYNKLEITIDEEVYTFPISDPYITPE